LVDEDANHKRGNLPFGNVRDADAVLRFPSGAKLGPCHDPATPARRTSIDPSTVSGSDAAQGRVKFFNAAKSFGFVVLADGQEVFVHAKQVVGAARLLRQGDLVRS
jgi:cold shock CspA family protein